MLGLTGGIGAGKSTAAELFAQLGAVVIDTDHVAREVVEPGGPAYQPVVDRFGPGIVGRDGTIDRSRLADLVFSDPAARADLNALVHPAVEAAVTTRLAEEKGSGRVVVLVVPLLVEAGWDRLVSSVAVVDCPEDVAVRRLVDSRGMDESDARRRVAAQASREDRLASADYVLDNRGSIADLRRQVEALWSSWS